MSRDAAEPTRGVPFVSDDGAAADDPLASLQDGPQLHRGSFVPLYFQLAEILKERIEAGAWPAGARFLSERELCDQFGVSRTVVRPALTMLEGDGQLVRIKGRGTFVAREKTVERIHGLTRTLSRPIPPGTSIRILDSAIQKPEQHIADELGLESRRAAVAHLTTVISIQGSPLVLCDSFVAVGRVPEIRSLVGAVRSLGQGEVPLLELELAHSQVGIQASYCSEFEAHQFGIGAGALVFLIHYVEHAVFPHSDTPVPVELARLVYRADTIQLVGALH